MTDEKPTPEDIQNETENTAAPEVKKDEAPPVAGETPASPDTPQDPTLLGALTPQEKAVLGNLQRRAQQLTLELGKLDLQMSQIRSQVKAADDQSQGILIQVGQRLGIPETVAWTVGGDGNARAIPPQMLQAMQSGMTPQPRPQPPAATASQPAPEGEKPEEGSKEE